MYQDFVSVDFRVEGETGTFSPSIEEGVPRGPTEGIWGYFFEKKQNEACEAGLGRLANESPGRGGELDEDG